MVRQSKGSVSKSEEQEKVKPQRVSYKNFDDRVGTKQ